MFPEFDYGSVAVHADKIIKYILAFGLLYVIMPGLMFKSTRNTGLETLISNYIKMVIFLILTGYILVALKLFEVISVMIIVAGMVLRKFLFENRVSGLKDLYTLMQIRLINYTDGLITPLKTLKKQIDSIRNAVMPKIVKLAHPANLLERLPLLCIISFSAWIRFEDALTHAAPPLSDAYVTLAWMKYINNRIMFHDGIYPQGFHIYLAYLQKFSVVDSLYVLRYTGPLNSIFIIFSLYFIVSRLTSNKLAGLASAFVYGIAGSMLTMGWVRHASTNSQEFAFVFVMPALYFYYMYMRHNKREYLIVAAAATAVTGLVHTLAFMFVGLGMGIILLLLLIGRYRQKLRRIVSVCCAGVLSVIVSVIPLGLGYLIGSQLHSSSSDYLSGTVEGMAMADMVPELMIADYAALGSMVLMVIHLTVLVFRRNKEEAEAVKFILVFGLAAFLLYFIGGAVTKSIVIATRSGELWAMSCAVLIGMGIHVLSRLFCLITGTRAVFYLVVCLSIAVFVVITKPEPMKPYKMEWDSTVEQYLRISKMFRPTEWTIVSSQGETYSMVYGKGIHVYAETMLKNANPHYKDPFGNGYSNNIFIYHEKRIFEVNKSNVIYSLLEKDYVRRRAESEMLETWLEIYKRDHDNISVFYEDSVLTVYYIKRKETGEERFENIWGEVLLRVQ